MCVYKHAPKNVWLLPVFGYFETTTTNPKKKNKQKLFSLQLHVYKFFEFTTLHWVFFNYAITIE